MEVMQTVIELELIEEYKAFKEVQIASFFTLL